MNKYEVEKLEIHIGDILLHVYRPKKYLLNRKTIIHYHGWGSKIETYDLFGKIYAEEGYQLVLPELPNHSKRGSIDYSSYTKAFDVAIQTIAEYSGVKEVIVDRLNGDRENLVISGHSLGGVIASAIFSMDKDIKLALIYNGIIDYSYYKTGALGAEDVDEETMEVFYSFDPMEFYKNLDGRNMLFMTGLLDNIIPPETMKNFEKKINSMDIDTSNMEFSYHEISAHPITYKMLKEGLEKTIKTIGRQDFSPCCHKK